MKPFRNKTDVERFGRLCICGHYKHNHGWAKISFLTFFIIQPCDNCTCGNYKADKRRDNNNNLVN